MNYNFTFLSFEETMAGMLGTITNAVMRPLTYSVTPQQTETLSIQAAPTLGSQAIAYTNTSKPMTPTKETAETWKTGETGADNTAEKGEPTATATATPWEKITTEKTPTLVTIYTLYENFAKAYVSDDPTRPNPGTYLPGTLKKMDLSQLVGMREARFDPHYYYISNQYKEKYYEFCKNLFIKGQSQTGGLERALQQTQAAAALPTR